MYDPAKAERGKLKVQKLRRGTAKRGPRSDKSARQPAKPKSIGTIIVYRYEPPIRALPYKTTYIISGYGSLAQTVYSLFILKKDYPRQLSDIAGNPAPVELQQFAEQLQELGGFGIEIHRDRIIVQNSTDYWTEIDQGRRIRRQGATGLG
jgi:hypothetical protein